MSRINVLVATVSPDVKAEVIAESVAARPDMTLVGGRCVALADVDAILAALPAGTSCALVLVGRGTETDEPAQRWLMERAELAVLHVDVVDDIVRIALRDPRLDALLTVLRGLAERAGAEAQERVARVQLWSGAEAPAAPEPDLPDVTDALALEDDALALEDHAAPVPPAPPPAPLLEAAIDWLQARFREAVERVPDDNGDVHGFSVTRATLLQSLDASAGSDAAAPPSGHDDRDDSLAAALADSDASSEPLAVSARALALGPLEFRMMVLALAPELDLRFQRCIGFLLDDMSRRVGTMALYASLLGDTAAVREELARTGALARWLVFEGYPGRPAAADEPLRLDPALVQWLLGEAAALGRDPRVRRALRPVQWPGAGLLDRREERTGAAHLICRLQFPGRTPWILLCGDDPPGWRALVELGAGIEHAAVLRVEPARLGGVDPVDVEECARRIGRMARLTGRPLVVDLPAEAGTDADDDGLRVFLGTLGRTAWQAAVICPDQARVVRLLGPVAFELAEEPALPQEARVAAVREAATQADAYLTEEAAAGMVRRYPLRVDALEHATRLARSRPLDYAHDDPRLDRFTAACREVAAEGVSQLADRIEPVFTLDQVVLPKEQKDQLVEIVDHVRLTDQVLDGWKFREQLPYGRGVTALFFGPSGAGKTMGAMAIARELGIQLLRLDFSRVVSKYIGDTEKNIDRVFTDARRSGAAILIDEADALLGKRSEVKDAHDRYANIEVAYLLQRMELYDGLAILTTNMKQNLDPAFLRRLRFIVDFPRPDVDARRQIWRQCLPEGSHALDDAAFNQLARRIDLTGGNIRQITLRAAFIAAAAGERIGLVHIAKAARAEFAKLGMPPVELDLDQARRAA